MQKGFEHVGVRAEVTRDIERIDAAAGVVLPGVGAFGACMENLEKFGLVEVVHRALDSGRPFLGICVGLQLLFEESEEYGPVAGLGILRGRCKRFRSVDDPEYRVPHMGWNQIDLKTPSRLFDGVADGSFVYFVHSYYVESDNPAVVAASTTYGTDFVASVVRDNVYGCQFHPEKSQKVGLKILENFGKIVTAENSSVGPTGN